MSVKPKHLLDVLDTWERIEPDNLGVREVCIGPMTLRYFRALVEIWALDGGPSLHKRVEELREREDA